MLTKSIVVLIVEDDLLLRMLAAEVVTEAGFVALEAGDADEAIALLEARPEIALLFTDIDMPGIDGGAFAATLRESEAGKKIPILFLSSMISVAESDAGHGHVGNWPMLSKKTPFHG